MTCGFDFGDAIATHRDNMGARCFPTLSYPGFSLQGFCDFLYLLSRQWSARPSISFNLEKITTSRDPHIPKRPKFACEAKVGYPIPILLDTAPASRL